MTAATPDDAPLPALAVLALSSFFCALGLYAISVILPQMQAAFADRPNAALMVTLTAGVAPMSFALSAPWIGRLIERHGYRTVYLISLLVFAGLGAVGAVLPNLSAIVLSRVVMGVAVSGVLNSGSAGIGALPERQRNLIFGVQAEMGGLASLTAFPAMGLISAHGWRWSFCIFLSALVAVPLAAPLRPAPRATSAAHLEGSAGRFPVSPLLVVLTVYYGLAIFTGAVFSPFFLKSIGVTRPQDIAIPLSAMSLCSLAMASLYGLVRRRVSMAGVFPICLALVGLGLAVSSRSRELLPFTVGLGTMGAGFGLLMPSLNNAAAAAQPAQAARAVTMISALLYGP